MYNTLGYGFYERVYEMALAVEFEEMGIKFARQVPLKVGYKGRIVGEYLADFVIDDVIVELKAVDEISSVHGRQLLNYLKAGGFRGWISFEFWVEGWDSEEGEERVMIL